jgi:hypothetical protein
MGIAVRIEGSYTRSPEGDHSPSWAVNDRQPTASDLENDMSLQQSSFLPFFLFKLVWLALMIGLSVARVSKTQSYSSFYVKSASNVSSTKTQWARRRRQWCLTSTRDGSFHRKGTP